MVDVGDSETEARPLSPIKEEPEEKPSVHEDEESMEVDVDYFALSVRREAYTRLDQCLTSNDSVDQEARQYWTRL